MTISLSTTDIELPGEIPSGLSRYSGRREMARGGNGLLQTGYDRISGRVVAIKSLLPEHRGDRDRRRRLLREARVTAQLQHPGVVPVYEINEDEELGVYYTMKRISGENFFEVLKQIALKDAKTIEAFPLPVRVSVIISVCQCLAYCHARGVIHRDLKPENIIVGNFGEVILLDWGTAKVWGQADEHFASESKAGLQPKRVPSEPPGPIQHNESVQKFERAISTLTPSARLIGTPTYMSPEQVSSEPVDERSDVFAMGICLYESLAIREPFRGSDREETFDNIRLRSPTPPSERSPQQNIPKAYDAIVARALHKQRAARYQSMRELIADVKAVVG